MSHVSNCQRNRSIKQNSCNKHHSTPVKGKVTGKAESRMPSVNLGNTQRTRLELHKAMIRDIDNTLQLYSQVRGKAWPAEQQQADGEKAVCITAYHCLPQKPLVMPPSFLKAVLAISCPPHSCCRLTAAAETPPASTIPPIKQKHPWTLYSAHQLVLLTCGPFRPVPATFSAFPTPASSPGHMILY